MKKSLTKILCLLIASVMLLSVTAYAAFEDLTDVEGHWGEEYLKKSYDDEILIGYEDNTMRPDKDIDLCEVMTIITRMMDMDVSSVSPELGLAGDEWYAEEVSAAYEMGLFEKGQAFESGMKRQDVFYAIAEAFCLTKAEPNYDLLSAYSDRDQISSKNRAAVASLLEDGYIIGFAGELTPNLPITRAEFVTIIYRLVDRVKYTGSESSFVSEKDSMANVTGERIWMACSTSRLNLVNVKADRLVIRSDEISNFYTAASRFSKVAIGTPDEFTLSRISYVGDVSVHGKGGKVNIAQDVNSVEVVSTGRDIEIRADVDKVIISGSGNTVRISEGDVGEVVLNGTDNKLIVGTDVKSVSVKGQNSVIEGTGEIGTLYVFTSKYTCSAPYASIVYDGLLCADVALSAPSSLPAGEKLVVTASVSNAEAKTYTAYWTIDGVKQPEFIADLSAVTTFTFEYEYTYTYNMQKTGKVEFAIVDNGGEVEKKTATVSYDVENYPMDHYYDGDILKVVTTGYKGNYTLKWAQDHDYTDFEKVLWVNTKGYTSDTEYLIWVSIAYQRCNVFKNVNGTWELVRSSIVATGKSSTATPVGVYKTTYKQSGWYTPDYTCYPVVRFYAGTGYAFHSRLYRPGSTTVLLDPSIGYPVSLGCIRMYDEDIRYLYNNIPSGTTVVVY